MSSFIGAPGDDAFVGTAQDDVFDGLGGNDALTDTLGGADTISGGDGDDRILVERIDSSVGDVTIFGGDGADLIRFSTQNSSAISIDAGAGDDRVAFSYINVTADITLGAGSDVLEVGYFQGSQGYRGQYVVTDFATGDGGDRLDILMYLLGGLNGWDRNTNPFASGDAFGNHGFLRLVQEGPDTVLYLDQDGARGGGYETAVFIFQNTVRDDFTAYNLGGYGFGGSQPAGQTLGGTSGPDILIGGFGNDWIHGGAGDDVLEGGGGDDALYGGDGANTLSYAHSSLPVAVSLSIVGRPQDTFGAGFDTLGDYFQTLIGSAYSDELSGGAVTLIGGLGDDYLHGFFPNAPTTASYIDMTAGVTVDLNLSGRQDTGAGGWDTLADIANLTGSHYNDVLTGNGAANTLRGEDGDDQLRGGGGDDVLLGGAGQNLLDGGAGLDTVSYADWMTAVTAALGAGAPAPSTGDTFVDIENLTGGAGDDVLTGDGGANVLTGGLGDDHLIGGGGDDVLYGAVDWATNWNVADGDDLLEGGDGADRLYGGNGVNTLKGGSGDDTFYNDGAVLDVHGEDGDDFLDLVNGARTGVYDGGAGIDRLRGNNIDISGATLIGVERLEAWTVTATAAQFAAFTQVGGTLILASSGIVDFSQNGVGALQVTGSAGDDTIIGSSFNDVLYTAAGDNKLYGGAGNDELYSPEILSGGAVAGANLLDGGDGHDILRGGAGNDVLVGGAGADTLTISRGSVVSASGGTGADIFYLGNGLRTGVIDGGADYDRLVATNVDLSQVTIGGIERLDAEQVIGTAEQFAAFTYITNAWSGSPEVNRLNLVLKSGGSVDFSASAMVKLNLTGSSGADLIMGSNFDDVMHLGGGDDSLEGRGGADLLDGGAGVDTAKYTRGFSGVTVNLSLTTAQNTGGAGLDTLISIENLVGSNYADTLTGSSGVNQIDGGLGDDLLTGGLGDDLLIGGQGADTAAFAATLAGSTINRSGGQIRVVSADGLDTLSGVELLKFTDGTLKIDSLLDIAGLYADFFGRDPGASEALAWQDAFARGAATTATLRATLIGLPDGQARIAAVIDDRYQTFFGRAASVNEINVWRGAIAGGASYGDLRSALVSTAYGQAHIGAVTSQLYQDYFGRAASGAEISVWTNAVVNGAGYEDIRSALVNTAYGQAHIGVAVAELYQTYLARPADADEISVWTNAVVGGTSYASIRSVLVHTAVGQAHIAVATNDAYQTYFGRAASSDEIGVWTSAVLNGASFGDIRSALVHTAYGQAHIGAVTDGLYQTYFGRAASSAEISVWTSAVVNGASFEDVRSTLTHTAYGQAHIAAETTELYQLYFGRAPSGGELDFWTGAIVSGASDFAGLRAALGGSAFGQSHLAAVTTDLYQLYFGRAATSQELAVWKQEIDRGSDLTTLTDILMSASSSTPHLTGSNADDVFAFTAGSADTVIENFSPDHDALELRISGQQMVGHAHAVTGLNDVLVEYDSGLSVLLKNVGLASLHADDFLLI